MKVTFFSNFLNHHQIPISNEFYELLGLDYTFVACEKVPEERLKLGYLDDFSCYPYYLEVSDEASYQKALLLGRESDVVIIGSADNIYIEERIRQNKLTFRYSERLFKTNKHVVLYPLILLSRLISDVSLRKKNVYMLSSSAFTPLDYSLLFSYPKKFYKWGYFPEFVLQDTKLLEVKKEHDRIEILWVGRMIQWKRPMMAIKVIEKLLTQGFSCRLKMIGTGPLEETIKTYIKEHNLSDSIDVLGPMNPKLVRDYMEQANIFLCTSTKQEGWGAVLNEAMNSGCATYAYYKIGAAPYLIKHGYNGKMFTNQLDLYHQLSIDLKSPNQFFQMGVHGYETIHDLWNPKIAANRFLVIAENLLHKNTKNDYDLGPMSKANVITSSRMMKKQRKI